MLGIEKLLDKLNQSSEGPGVQPGFRPKGWEIPPKMTGDSDVIMTTGNADGTHKIVRLPKTDNGQIKPQERKT